MNRAQYLKELSKYLDKLPKADFEDAINHFEECFDEVGVEGEASLIAELGKPRVVATDLLSNLIVEDKRVDDPVAEQKKNNKFGKTLLISLLCILAAPIGLPLTIAFIALVFALLMVVGAIIIAFASICIAGFAVTIKLLFIGLLTTATSFSGGLILIGSGLLVLTLTILGGAITYLFVRLLVYCLKRIVAYVSSKGVNGHE